ncbi:hypothetical protein LX64_00062 [Chitinophaga skermanii]|uniref:Uncharacterized protein n=1 Tax=Chitinophaga skermanii TaxID=331697 RepID=A0A327R1D3_9BACT|nr:DUF3833 domain-containing protein [Chitinophaga skermanii]RAJ10460.1 hypothetical protein LX64_00062 [Chitinophaga skermanii]
MKYILLAYSLLLIVACSKPDYTNFPGRSPRLALIKNQQGDVVDSLVYDLSGKLVRRFHFGTYHASDITGHYYTFDAQGRVTMSAALSLNPDYTVNNSYYDTIRYVYNANQTVSVLRNYNWMIVDMYVSYDQNGVITQAISIDSVATGDQPKYILTNQVVNKNIVSYKERFYNPNDGNFFFDEDVTIQYDNQPNPFFELHKKNPIAFTFYDAASEYNMVNTKNNALSRHEVGAYYDRFVQSWYTYHPQLGYPLTAKAGSVAAGDTTVTFYAEYIYK